MSAAATPVPPTHQAPPPSPAWWFVGGSCLVAGIVLGGYLLINLFVTMFDTTATIRGDDGVSLVEVEAGHDYLLWLENTGPSPVCTVTDAVTQREVAVRSMGHTTLNRNDQTADGWFEAPSDRVTVECSGPGEVEIGRRPGTPPWVGGVAGAIALPVLLFAAGFVVLVVTGIRLSMAGRRP